ncbi:MAG TPA: slipin family protein [Rhizomicrobium sp.]|jgi:regulator of protease activity HflC (stomatin/prohibitin superfamily)|nr:slipin family protein [Rhizomicrobium sp.]
MSIVILVALAVAFYLLAGIRIAQEYERGVVFRLGRYQSVKGPGLYWIAPIFDRQWKLDLRTRTVTVEQQETITRDSVTIKVNAVLWYRISDPSLAIVQVQNYQAAVYQLALTSLRNIIGQHQLDEVLKERDGINGTLKTIVDAATTPWGIHIEMVEMKDVEIPEGMQRAMAREAEAIREKRARLIKAEAEAEASLKLADAAGLMAGNPAALELRRMQMVSEIGAEHNTTTIVLMPSEMVGMGHALAKMAAS